MKTSLGNRNTKPAIHVYFQVHQPCRLKRIPFFDIGAGASCFNDKLNKDIMHRVAQRGYLPTNLLLHRLIRKYPQIKITFSISGTALDQLQRFAPAALDSFRMLAATGNVEFLAETYYHSLASLNSKEEFVDQVNMHTAKVNQLFGVTPSVFRNTELIYSEQIGKWISEMGFKGTIIDGIDRLQKVCNPHHVYEQPSTGLRLLLRDYKLSDDIAFRYSDINWKEWPLTSKKYLKWLYAVNGGAEIINLGMDYETFGEHQHEVTGIFRFLEEVLIGIVRQSRFTMVTASEAIEKISLKRKLRINSVISWADSERDLTAWLGNAMQTDAFDTVCAFEKEVKQLNDPSLLHTWRHLQASDHFYYMSIKKGDDGEVHNHFSPYPSPHEAFVNYMNVLTDFSIQLRRVLPAWHIRTHRTKSIYAIGQVYPRIWTASSSLEERIKSKQIEKR
jgi:alpha-amylase